MTNGDEVDYVAVAIWRKVFQADETKRRLAEHCARIAVRAHWEWGDGPGALEPGP